MNKRTIQSLMILTVLALLVTFSNSCKKDDNGNGDGDGDGGNGNVSTGTYLNTNKVKGTHREGLTGCPQLLGIVQISNRKVGSSAVTADSFAITSNYNGIAFKIDGVERKSGNLDDSRKISVLFDCTNQGPVDYENLIELYKGGKKVHLDKLRSEVEYIK